MEPVLEFDFALNEEMALTKGDQNWIIEQHALSHTGFVRWLRDWGVLGTFIVSAIGVLSIAATCAFFAVSEVRNNSEFRGQTRSRLDRIEEDLRTLRASKDPKGVLGELAGMAQRDFSRNLPALKAVLQQPVADAQATPAILHAVASKLQTTDDRSVGFWEVTLRFIQFASSATSIDVPPPGTKPNVRIGKNQGFTPLGPFEHCVADLDGGDIGPARFESCRIRFTQNPVSFQNVTFVNCLFEMPESDNPSPYLRAVSHILLASNLKDASFSRL
jgi:hypothetical protein